MGAGEPQILGPGKLERHSNFRSSLVEKRNIDVWLPEGYDANRDQPYSVLYLHDGQNLFEPDLAFAGVDWGIHESLSELIGAGRARETIAVGIWNTPQRLLRYMPRRPFELSKDKEAFNLFVKRHGGSPTSDKYLRFIVSELKPFIEERYTVSRSRDDTFIMGASMGGLISLYAVCEYPSVFGGAACLSTSWTIAGDAFLDYLKSHLPKGGGHRFYFDYGLEAEIEGYTDFQDSATALAISSGYIEDATWSVRVFPDHDHSERSWRSRVSIPLEYLLGDHNS